MNIFAVMEIDKIIGQNIKRIRKSQGLTQKMLCEKADLMQARLSELENGKTPPNVKTLEKVAAALAIPLAELFRDTTKANQSLLDKLQAIEALPKEKRKSLLMTIDVFLKEHNALKRGRKKNE
jgi:transcriptional regulator with XRE-family HTH domain